MQWKIPEKSLFNRLLYSPWWVSFLIALVWGLVARLVFSAEYAPYAMSGVIPFLIVGVIAAWKQWRVPGPSRVAATAEAVGAMTWREFAAMMEEAFERDGYVVTRLSGAADFRLVKGGRTSLVSCKRWKAASHGLESLRELDAAREAEVAQDAMYVAIGEITENARRFAREQRISLIEPLQLTSLLRLPRRTRKTAS